ncbi:sushi, von Willebrand factor type A, EGF and pentraxin domain-containing protein 1-like isoform X5 [Leptopilina boulardi]|uniref:sushi, von Willebrand factor type A, EGF and pentraxin domain-containing protein 1-like isoform X5 n=1 Tax=Leptopilina boulardi TaxID=63433 RepID=UPI0021F69583|nr:sushi, von Willebrand factor type A, EGF and pentraxin domain-containing protein 1-like isoform X5 [Leptopilina boulardi]
MDFDRNKLILTIFIALFIPNVQSSTETELKCEPLEIRNAQFVTLENYNKGLVLCNDFHVLQGDSTLTCINGKWSGERPICIPYTCLKSSETYYYIDNGMAVDRKIGNDGQVYVEYSCNKNYTLIGRNWAVCIDGEWSNLPPQCKLSKNLKCPEISFKYGQIQLNDEGDIATLTCDLNYLLTGNSTIICSNGIWKTEDYPECTPTDSLLIKAQYLEMDSFTLRYFDIENCKDETEEISYTGRTLLKYSCNTNYTLIGENWAMRIYGKLFNDPPVCKLTKELECLPFYYEKEYVTFNKYGNELYARIECNEFSYYNGNEKIPENVNAAIGVNKCINGTWGIDIESDEPCLPLQCDTTVENGRASVSKWYMSMKLYCNTNYEPIVDEILNCNPSTGRWLPSYSFVPFESRNAITNCYHHNCLRNSTFYNLSNGYVEKTFPDKKTVTLNYYCNENYTLIGEQSVTCDDGKWLKTPPQCKLTKTLKCPPFKYGSSSVTFLEDGNIARINCDDSGTFLRTIEMTKVRENLSMGEQRCINGNWTGDINYKNCERCVRINMDNAIVMNDQWDTRMIIYCLSKHVLEGDSNFICHRNIWVPSTSDGELIVNSEKKFPPVCKDLFDKFVIDSLNKPYRNG